MKRRGFNLVEVLIAVVLIGFVSIGLFVLIGFPLDVNVYSQKEFDIQSDMRVSSETINSYVRDATAAFLITKKDEKYTKGWNYFICENDGVHSRIVVHEWNGSAHNKKILAEVAADEAVFFVRFQKNKDGKLLKYKLSAKDLKRNKIYDIETELKALNSVNIIDESSMDYSLSPPEKSANCLAFRTDRPDPDLHDDGYHHVSVSFVLDCSGSMNDDLDGNTTSDLNRRRIGILKKQLNSFFKTMKDQDKAGIVDVRVYPFSFYMAFNDFRACPLNLEHYYSLPLGSSSNRYFEYGEKYGKFLNIKKESKPFLDGMVSDLVAVGATNVGDGIRHAMQGIKNYEDEKRLGPGGKNKRIKHYLFVLTDGVPTYLTVTDNKDLFPSDACEPVQNRVFSRYRYTKIYRPYSNPPQTCYYDTNFLYGFKKDSYGNYIYNHQDVVYLGNGMAVDNGVFNTTQLKDNKGSGWFSTSGYQAEILYVEKMSDFVKRYRSQNPDESVEVTVVGFSNRSSDNKYCDRIGKALGAPAEANGKHFKESGSDAALQAIFKSFTESVVASTLWYVAGPQ